MTNSEINRLGDQLREAAKLNLSLDVEALQNYRLSYAEALHEIKQKLASNIEDTIPTERAKSTSSIVDKLIRLPTSRLIQMQDVIGLRYIVAGLEAQDRIGEIVKKLFQNHKSYDRRLKPTYGYRGLHIVVMAQARSVEIQIRTEFQHLWAEVSELLADREGHELKYGGGNPSYQRHLLEVSNKIARREIELRDLGLALSSMQVKAEVLAMLPKELGVEL